MGIKIKGLKQLERKLKEVEREVQKTSGTREVPIEELLPPEFMTRFTAFRSAEEMIEKSGFEVKSAEDFKSIPDDQWDAYVASTTQFSTWADMLSTASSEYIQRRFQL